MSSKADSITVILNIFKRPANFKRQIEAILAQSVPIQEIWICAFASPFFELLYHESQAFNDPRIHWIYSDINFKYYGRFQAALQAKTEYIYSVDDDIIPGCLYLERCLNTIQTEETRGNLSNAGWILPEGTTRNPFRHYRKGKLIFGPNTITPIDVNCHSHFLETSWVKLLFREKPFTWESGEDFMLSYVIRKYTHFGCFAMPIVRSDPTTWGFSLDAMALAWDQPATVGEMIHLRQDISNHIFKRGNPLIQMENLRKTDTQMIFIDKQADIDIYMKHHWENKNVLITYTNQAEIEESAQNRLNEVLTSSAISEKPIEFDLKLGWDFSRKSTPSDIAAETLTAFSSILENTQPNTVNFTNTQTPSAKAAMMACEFKSIPFQILS